MLALAKDAALRWLQEDAHGFWSGVQSAMEPLSRLEAALKRFSAARATASDTDLSALLKVSAYAGNVGFDLLVPDLEERTVLQVEVKRVPALDGAAFFLSENERRQALALGSGWRLWLVASDGTSRDVSWIRDELLRSEESVGSLLRPGTSARGLDLQAVVTLSVEALQDSTVTFTRQRDRRDSSGEVDALE